MCVRVCVRVLYMSVYIHFTFLVVISLKTANQWRDVATKETIVTIV